MIEVGGRCRLALAVAFLIPSGLSAQNKTAALAGVVTDSLQRPIAEVEIRVSGLTRPVRTDSAGRFLITGLAVGTIRVAARRIGYLPAEATTQLTSEKTAQVSFVLHASAQDLAPVIVRSRRESGYSLSENQIARTPYATVADLLSHHKRMLGDAERKCVPPYWTRPLQVFINGENWPMWRLLDHDPGDIAEMHYINCWDKTTPQLRQSLIVNLKPGIRP